MAQSEGYVEPGKVVVRGIRGKVKWFSIFNHYGFINRHDNGEDVFVHLDGIVQHRKIRFGLDADLEVEMDVASGFKGMKAVGVTLPGGLPIENTRIVRFRGGTRRTQIKKEEVETADKGEQPKQESDDKGQSVNENKSQYDRPKRFTRRRRGSTVTGEEIDQAGGDAEKDSSPVDKPAVVDGLKVEETKPNVEQAKKADGAKPVATDSKKQAEFAKVQAVNEKKGAQPSGDFKKQATVDKSKVELNKTSESIKAKPEDKRNSAGHALVDNAKKETASIGKPKQAPVNKPKQIPVGKPKLNEPKADSKKTTQPVKAKPEDKRKSFFGGVMSYLAGEDDETSETTAAKDESSK